MKFANIYWQNTQIIDSNVVAVNIGDNLQFMAIDYLYSKFLPESEQIVKLQMNEMKQYKGEDLILPMNWCLFDPAFMNGDKIAISEDIIPIFLGMTIESAYFRETYFNEFNIAYLKRCEPIGCRDEYTCDVLHKYHIRAYLNGCMTSIFPIREDKNQDTILFIDVPVELFPYIPNEIKEKYKVMTQQYYFNENLEKEKILDFIKDQYRKYADEAGLVVTSRLHVASPCMAMGIPVIFVKNQVDARFGWLDVYLPLYDKEHYNQIDWNPDPIKYEVKKEIIVQNAIKRIMGVYEQYCRADEVGVLYKARKENNYIGFQQTIYNNFEKAIYFLQDNYSREDRFLYGIWGINSAAENFYLFMKREYPNAQLNSVIDKYKTTEFHGISVIKPDDYIMKDNEIIFVLPVKASNEAGRVFAQKGIDSKYYVCCGDRFIIT